MAGIGVFVLNRMPIMQVEALWVLTTFALGGAGLLGLWTASKLMNRGNRHLAALAPQATAKDPRPPVVYLRPFAYEKQLLDAEEELGVLLSSIGPFIAVGNPADRLPPLGAARAYFQQGDADWQEFIRTSVARASLVILALGKSDGILWEFRTCRSIMSPQNLLILLYGSDEEIRESLETLRRELEMHVAKLTIPLQRSTSFGEWRGLISFDQAWHPKYHELLPPAGERWIGYSDEDLRGAWGKWDIVQFVLNEALPKELKSHIPPPPERPDLIKPWVKAEGPYAMNALFIMLLQYTFIWTKRFFRRKAVR